MKTYRQIIKEGEQTLLQAGVENAAGEAWYFFERAFSITRMDYLLDQGQPCMDQKAYDRYQDFITKRAVEHIPMQYLLGSEEFMGLTFKVTPAVLIPRQDTEILVEEVVNYIKESGESKSVLDMCTGSGCIAISIANYAHVSSCTGADLSKDALKIAKENGKTLSPMVEFINSDLFEQINGTFDIIVSNPPYIASEECEKLMMEVKDHEPRMALDGHEDGLFFYRKIINQAPEYLHSGGMLFFEIGYDQGESVPELMEQAGFSNIVVKKDLAGLDRVVYGVFEGGK